MTRAVVFAALAFLPLLGGCDALDDDSERTETAREFPPADRPVATTVSTKWSTEEARDRVNEADDVMDSADVRPGMTVADIGAGDGYYTVRLAQRVGAGGRVAIPFADRRPRHACFGRDRSGGGLSARDAPPRGGASESGSMNRRKPCEPSAGATRSGCSYRPLRRRKGSRRSER